MSFSLIFDFINFRTLLEGQEESLENLIKSIKYDLSNAFYIRKKTMIEDGLVIETFKTTHFYFNYFNRFQIIQVPNRRRKCNRRVD